MRSKRKKDYIDPEVQGALARRLVVHWVFFLTVAALLAVGLKWMRDPFAPFAQHMSEAWATYGPLMMVLVCLAPIFIYDSIKLSHRFTGPMFRLRQVTKSLANGETPSQVEFRGADFWKDLAIDFNRIIDRYAKKNETVAEESATSPATGGQA